MPSPAASRRNLGAYLRQMSAISKQRHWRSARETIYIKSLVWQWLQSPGETREQRHPPCTRGRYHRFRRGRCRCGYERSYDTEYRLSARKLAQKIGVSHTWVNWLVRCFRTDPERQLRAERTWGAASMEQLRAEQAKREGDYARYRQKQIKRVARPQTSSGGLIVDSSGNPCVVDRAALERQLEEFMKTHGVSMCAARPKRQTNSGGESRC